MCQNLPLVDPRKIDVPILILRGEYDGIAAFDDLVEFFRLLPNSDKQFIVIPGAAHSGLHGKNFRTNFHVMHSYWSQPDAVYLG
jgi:pimeloyl-ACP methyl ester carboxylesterase